MTCRARSAPRAKSSGLELGVLQRTGDAGAAEERPLDGGGHGAGIEHVDAGVGAGVEAADDQVGRLRQQFAQGQLDAVGRPALDRPAQRLLLLVEDFLHDQRRRSA